MVLPGIVDQWNYWTDECDPQEFMNLGRIQGHPTIGSAVDAYVVEIPGLDRAWAGLNAEELEGDSRCADVVSLPHTQRGVDIVQSHDSNWKGLLLGVQGR